MDEEIEEQAVPFLIYDQNTKSKFLFFYKILWHSLYTYYKVHYISDYFYFY